MSEVVPEDQCELQFSSKKCRKIAGGDEESSQWVRKVQSLFQNAGQQQPQVKRKRVELLGDVKSLLENSSCQDNVCSIVVINYLKNFVKFFNSSQAPNLRNHEAELEIVKLVVMKFSSFVPSHRSWLQQMLLRELNFVSSLNCINYEDYVCDLYVKIALAGKWSGVNTSPYRLHYQAQVEKSLNSTYFLAHKYELHKTIQNEEIELPENGDSFVDSRENLLEWCKESPESCVSHLINILKRFIAVQSMHVGNFPIKKVISFTRNVLNHHRNVSSLETSNLSGLMKKESIEILKLLCMRFGSTLMPFIHPVLPDLAFYTSKAAGLLGKVDRCQHSLEDIAISSRVLQLNTCLIRNVTRYVFWFDRDFLGSIMVSVLDRLYRYASFQSNLIADNSNTPTAEKGKKQNSRKRKRAAQIKETVLSENMLNTSPEMESFLAPVLDFSACVFERCSDLLQADVLHKAMQSIVALSMIVFSSSHRECSIGSIQYLNLKVFQSAALKAKLLDNLSALVARPNPKYGPPLSILAELFSKAASDGNVDLAEKSKSALVLLESALKPNHAPPFPSIHVPYEPKVETEDNCCQTENQVTSANVYTQTQVRHAESEPVKSNVAEPQTKKVKNKLVQTEETVAMNADQKGVHVSRVTKSQELEVPSEQYDNFVDICEQFVPDVL